MPVMRVADAEEALRVANDSPMGLSGSVWSRDAARARALARALEAGSVCVNDVLVNYFVVEAPLGGVKRAASASATAPRVCASSAARDVVEDHPLLGWLTPRIDRELMTFPYRSRAHRLLRWFMKFFY
jgi:acyl-CoA reductase-like NAD-dependent aldehyde dehydrogenase